jgi:hypothetical protein
MHFSILLALFECKFTKMKQILGFIDCISLFTGCALIPIPNTNFSGDPLTLRSGPDRAPNRPISLQLSLDKLKTCPMDKLKFHGIAVLKIKMPKCSLVGMEVKPYLK